MFEMWMGPSHNNRRAGYSACLIKLEVGEGVFETGPEGPELED